VEAALTAHEPRIFEAFDALADAETSWEWYHPRCFSMSTSTRRRILPEALFGNRVDEFELPDALVRGDLARDPSHDLLARPSPSTRRRA